MSFLDGGMEEDEFCSAFIKLRRCLVNDWWSGTHHLEYQEQAIVDEMHSSCSSYTGDGSLRSENPTVFIDGEELRARISAAYLELRKAEGRSK